jgi:hypothetical protein
MTMLLVSIEFTLEAVKNPVGYEAGENKYNYLY